MLDSIEQALRVQGFRTRITSRLQVKASYQDVLPVLIAAVIECAQAAPTIVAHNDAATLYAGGYTVTLCEAKTSGILFIDAVAVSEKRAIMNARQLSALTSHAQEFLIEHKLSAVVRVNPSMLTLVLN